MAILGDTPRFLADAHEEDDFNVQNDDEGHSYMDRSGDWPGAGCDVEVRLTGSKSLFLPNPHRCSS